jgi:phosphoglycerate kinase
MLNFIHLKDCVVSNKNVIIRVDINVPINKGKIEDDTRIKAVIPTLSYLAKNQAKVIVISHFGRPKGKFNQEMSLSQLVSRIQELMPDFKVNFVDDCIGEKVESAVKSTNYGEIIILENLRFYPEEEKNDAEFSQKLASLGNLYINDAFSCSHRSHSSITGITKYLKSAAGFLMQSELENLANYLEKAKKPMMAVVGGAKVSTKIDLLNSLAKKAQTIVVGGAMANTFLYAIGKNIAKSMCEFELKETALEIIKNAKANNCDIILPYDVVVAKELSENSFSRNIEIENIAEDEMILDVGQKSTEIILNLLQNHQTILWNGPLGAFEIEPFDRSTKKLALEIAKLTAEGKLISISGGGDSVAAINSVGVGDKFSYISTAGGAFLEWLEGKDLPGIIALNNPVL